MIVSWSIMYWKGARIICISLAVSVAFQCFKMGVRRYREGKYILVDTCARCGINVII